MRLAALFLFFIAADILVFNRFLVLGLMPMTYFFTGMGFCLVFYYGRRFYPSAPPGLRRYLGVFLLGIFMFSLCEFVPNVAAGFCWDYYSDHMYMVIRIVLILTRYFAVYFGGLALALLAKPRWGDSRYGWLLAAAGMTAITHAISWVFRPVPVWYWRYGGGVVNLLMVFTWLMILMDALKRECHERD